MGHSESVVAFSEIVVLHGWWIMEPLGSGKHKQNPGGKGKRKAAANDGHQAKDEQMKTEVETHLHFHKEIDTTNVDVVVDHANVRLSGKVDNQHAQRLTERVVEDEVIGVKSIQNDVQFQRDDSQAP